MSTLVTLVTAQLAKEAEYNEPVYHYFHEPIMYEIVPYASYTDLDEETDYICIDDVKPQVYNNIDDFPHKYYSRPSQSDLQEWLRWEHKLHIGICGDGWIVQIYNITGQSRRETMEFDNSKRRFDSYELALEDGLQTVLKDLIKSNE